MYKRCVILVMLVLHGLPAGQLLAVESANDTLTPKLEPGYQPDPKSDEAGLWMSVENLEKELRHSPLVLENDIVNRYVEDVVCRLAGEYCADIRVYIIRNPHFNTTMYPNGMMHVWTGLLLRTKSEAQLAAVLGHEIAHYLLNHTVERWRSIKQTKSFSTFLKLGLSVVGGMAPTLTEMAPAMGEMAPGITEMAPAVTEIAPAGGWVILESQLAGISSYSKTQENEADLYALKLMANAGYAPKESALLWGAIERENERAKKKKGFKVFTFSHPASKDREKNLLEKIDADYPDSQKQAVHEARYIQAISPILQTLIEDELKMHNFEHTEGLLGYLSESAFPPAMLSFFKAEFYRLRKQEGDIKAAISAYEQSIMQPDTPAEAYRELGYLYYKRRDIKKAKKYFTDYLGFKPDASDRQMIELYLTRE